MQKEFEIDCVKVSLEDFMRSTREVYVGLDYWDARRMQHLIPSKNIYFIPVSVELDYLDWMAKKKNYSTRINYAYLDIIQNYNFGNRSAILLKNKCGNKQFYRIEGK